jgi:putative nucleotidyltransferase with HDIG domain
MRVGTIGRAICSSLKMSDEDLDIASMAGILHDAGKMILISRFPDEYDQALADSRKRGFPCYGAERQVMVASHAELGGYLLDLWGLPNPIIEAVTFHHEPWLSVQQGFSVTDAIYIANKLDKQRMCSMADGYVEPLDMDYLAERGVADMLPQWQLQHHAVLAEELQNVG